MSNFRAVTYVGCMCVGLLAVTTPHAKADAWDQKTTFTFSGPVEIPGKVLPPGTYVFKLVNSTSSRDIVQVFNQRENHLFGTFLAIPDYHLQPSSKPIITFEERAAGSPPAVRAWFYPGDNYGHDFVYPKVKATELAQLNNTPVTSIPDNVAQNTTTVPENPTPPETQELQQAPLTPEQPPQAEQQPPQETEAAAPPPPTQNEGEASRALPETASPMALTFLMGLLAIGGGALLALSGRRRSSVHR
jgi:hypothetical protein